MRDFLDTQLPLLTQSCMLDVHRAAKTKYGTILANVDYLHGSAESLLTVTNLLIGEPRACP